MLWFTAMEEEIRSWLYLYFRSVNLFYLMILNVSFRNRKTSKESLFRVMELLGLKETSETIKSNAYLELTILTLVLSY